MKMIIVAVAKNLCYPVVAHHQYRFVLKMRQNMLFLFQQYVQNCLPILLPVTGRLF